MTAPRWQQSFDQRLIFAPSRTLSISSQSTMFRKKSAQHQTVAERMSVNGWAILRSSSRLNDIEPPSP